MEKKNENASRIKKHLIQSYNQLLNNSLSKTILELKERILNLKSKLIEELKIDMLKIIKDGIKKNYSNYITFLLNLIKNEIKYIDKPPKVIIILNSIDYEFFNKNNKKINTLFTNKIEIQKSDSDFIGGFKVIFSKEKILFDYSIDNIIEKNSILIQKEILNAFDDSEIEDVEQKFINFIQKQKLGLEEYLKRYDQV
ncbi:MAG: hypothetical protein ACFFDO_01710 [Candidatus Thorarchaeota archaeon]